MRALVLGGAGLQGSGGARWLAKKDEISGIIVADINLEGAKKVADQIGDKAEAVRIDVAHRESLISLMKSADIVVNFSGPFVKYGVDVVKAAIEARVNYVDIMDDIEPIPDLLALDKFAKEAGVTILCGMGNSPGLTDLYAKYAFHKLDRTDEIQWAFMASLPADPSPTVQGHRIAMFGPRVPVIRNGDITYVRGGSARELIDWPEVGPVTAAVCAHPEPLMMLPNIKGVREASVKGSFSVEEFNQLAWHLSGDLALGSLKPLQVGEVTITSYDFIRYFVVSDEFKQTEIYRTILEKNQAIGECMGVRVVAKGQKDRKRVRYVYKYFSRDRNKPIYTPAVVGAHMVATGKIRLPGVSFPEALDPGPVLGELAKNGIVAEETVEYE